MVQQIFARIRLAAVLVAVALPACSAPNDSTETSQKVEQKSIRDPAQQNITDEIGNRILLDPAAAFDTRRDVFEDEKPEVGQDPDLGRPAP